MKNSKTAPCKKLFLTGLFSLLSLVLLLVTPVFAVNSVGPLAGENYKDLDDYIEGQRRELKSPGMAFVLVEQGEIVYTRGYGTADSGARAVEPQTPFLLGSVTKPITALAVLQLVEAGKINLDEPIQTYLPWFVTAEPFYSDRITVRHLLTQTSGFSTLTGQKQMADFDDSAAALENHVRSLMGETLSWGPGGAYQYSNANFTLLGLIIQTVSGQSYEEYVQQHIFAPLEMTHSFTDQAAAEQAGLAEGVRFWFKQPVPARLPFNRGDLPAAYLISSAADMGNFILAMLNDGVYKDRTILSAAGLAQMQAPAASIREGLGYGLGWFVADRQDGTRLVYHNGDLANYHAEIWLCPAENWGFALLMNANSMVEPHGFNSAAMGLVNQVAGRRLLPHLGGKNWFQTMLPLLIPLGITLVIVMVDFLSLLKWGRRPETRPTGPAAWVGRLALPVVILATVILALLVYIPALMEYPLRVVFLFAPDAGVLIALTLVLAALWATAGSMWKIRVFQKPLPRYAFNGSR